MIIKDNKILLEKDGEIMRKFLQKIFWFMTVIAYRIKITGKENIPQEGPALICANHVHAFDSVIIVSHTKRKINVLAKEELFKNGFMRFLAKVFGIYPIKQNSADLGAIKTSLKLLKNKELLLIFPEGTRNGMSKGTPIKNGPMTIAIKAEVPIIPIGIKGTFKPFSKIALNIGKPMYYNEYKDKTGDKEIITKLTNELMAEIIRLRDA